MYLKKTPNLSASEGEHTRGHIYNNDMTSFLLLRQPTQNDVDNVFIRAERFLHQETLERYSKLAVKHDLPMLFTLNYIKTKQGRQPYFVYVKRSAVVEKLGVPESTSALELCQMLRQSGHAPDFATSLLGKNYGELCLTVTNKTRELMNFSDLRESYRVIAEHAGHDDAPREFLEILTNFDEIENNGLTLRSAFAALLAFASEGCILHPLSLWRGMYPGSGPAPQRYLEMIAHPALLSPSKRRDLDVFQNAVASKVKKPEQASTLRVGAALLHATTARLNELDPESVFSVMNAWQAHAYSLVQDKKMVTEARCFLASCANVFADVLVTLGNSKAELFYEEHRIVNNFTLRKKVEGIKRSPDFRFLRSDVVTKADSGSQEELTVNSLASKEDEIRSKLRHVPDRDMNTWANLFVDYVKQVPVSRSISVITPIHVYCDWLIAHGHGIQSPNDLDRSDIARTAETTREVTFLEYLDSRYSDSSGSPSRAFGQASLFMDWYQSNVDVNFRNPFHKNDRPPLPSYDGKTSKESLPVRIISIMKEILKENDWEWAKQFEADYRFIGAKEVWCPARAVALYLLLEIPLRTIQVRLLDSGEGDELTYQTKLKKFAPNPNGLSGRRLGVFREFTSGGKRFTGLYINTNKTQALYSASDRQGYDIMWENESVNEALAFLRDWQMRYNPLKEPVHVNSLSDTTLHAPERIAKLVKPVFFLFRDKASIRTSPHEPISHQRIEMLYLHLLAAAEERLKEEGSDVTLITEWEPNGKTPRRAIVTLHSLRVSGITNFAEAGVPLHILTEFLAGHSTILMNLWYHKFGFATVNTVISKAASTNMTEMAAAQFQRWISDQAENSQSVDENSEDAFTDACRLLLAAGSVDAFGSMQKHPTGLWAMDIDGICPNGRTLCHEGGPRIGTKGWTRSTPVQGGRGNCPLCRYYVTGPMFLFGQIVKINVLLYHIQERSDEVVKLRNRLDDMQSALEVDNDVKRKIAELRSAIEVIDHEISNGLDTWVKRYEYLMKSQELLKCGGGSLADDAKNQLITSSDNNMVEVLQQDASRFDLLEFVNQACEIIEGVDVASAKYRKAKLLDMLLTREGKEPLFFALPDDVMLKVGNRMTRFMTDLIGDKGVSSVLAGQQSLAQAGIHDLDTILAQSTSGVILADRADDDNLLDAHRS